MTAYYAAMTQRPEKSVVLSLNIPDRLKTTLQQQADGSGSDLTGVVLRALHEFLAEPIIRANTTHTVMGKFHDGVACARCGNPPSMWVPLQDDPLYIVCAPHCADGPIDAHGNQLEVGDPVIVYIGSGGAVVGTILSFTVDGGLTELANIQVPGARRPYVQATRKIMKSDL